MDCREYSHSASAARAFQYIHFPHTFHELSPTIVPWMGTSRLRRLAASRLFSSAASVMTRGFCLGGERNDRSSPASCGGKQPSARPRLRCRYRKVLCQVQPEIGRQAVAAVNRGRQERNGYQNGYLGGIMASDAFRILLQVIDSKWCARQDSNLRPFDS
jgi:hypothetical protein